MLDCTIDHAGTIPSRPNRRRLDRTRARLIIGFFFLATMGMDVCAAADEPSANGGNAKQLQVRAPKVTYAILGHRYSYETLTAAYHQVRFNYVVHPITQERISPAAIGATRFTGRVKLVTGTGVWTKNPDACITRYRGALPVSNDPVDAMVIRHRTAWVSIRDEYHELVSIPHFADVTMTFNDFVFFLRNGFHFPEVPQLRTQDGRRRLFSIRSTKGSKVQEMLESQSQSSSSY